MDYRTDVLKKVQSTWNAHRDTQKVSQAKAADAMGMNQSAFSQYLRGAIPLNTDFLTKFSAFTGRELDDLGVTAGAASVSKRPVRVKCTLSGRRPTSPSILVESILECDDSYFVEVDYPDHSVPKGSMLLVSPKANIRCGEKVVYFRDEGEPLVFGEIEQTEDGWEITERLWRGGRRYLVEPEDLVFRVVSLYFPSPRGKKFR